MFLIRSIHSCRTFKLFVQTVLKTVLKQTAHRADICFDVYESPSHEDSKKQEEGYDLYENQFSIGSQQKMPSDFDKLLKLSSFKEELLRFFFVEIEHLEYAPIIGEKVLYCAINNERKKLYCRNDILKNERVPELYRNHLECDTRVVCHAKNADTIDPGNIVARANHSDIAVMLICNIHHMDSDVWYEMQDITMTTAENASTSRN